MTAKEFVRQRYPGTKSEKYRTRTGFHYYTYYLIRDGNSFMYIAEGETEAKAWKNAKEKIEKL